MLVLSQLKSGPSSFTGVKRTSSFVHASGGVRLASLESDRLLPCTEKCPNKWFGHAPSKLKLDKDNSNYFCGRE